MYPFDNFKFKNVKDNTLYLYEPIDTEQSTSSTIVEPSTLWQNTSQQNENANSAFLARTFTPSQTNENIEEFDFDFGFLDNIANDEPLRLQPTVAAVNETCAPPDDDGIDDFLNDLIHGKVENKFPDKVATAAHLENNNEISLNQFSFVEPCVQSLPPVRSLIANVEKKKLPPPPATVQLTKAKQKLSKCLATIAKKEEKKEKKPRRTKNPAPTKKTSTGKMEDNVLGMDISTKLGEVTKVYSRHLVSKKRLPSFEAAANEMDVGKKLLSLVQQQDVHKPLDLLQQLKSLEMSKANAPLVRRIITKSNVTPAISTKTEPNEIASNVADGLTSIKEEKQSKKLEPCTFAERPAAVHKPTNHSGGTGCSERRMPLTNGLPDLTSLFGFNDFGSISYENQDEPSFGRPLEFDQIVEEEVEIIPIEVDEDACTYEIETYAVSTVAELDLFGCSSLSGELDAPVVGDSHSLAQMQKISIDANTEVPAGVAEVDAPSKNKKPAKKKEKAATTKSKLPSDSQTPDAIVPSKAQVKRPTKKKIEKLKNSGGDVTANSDENATANPKLVKPARKPKKMKVTVSKEGIDENLAGFSLHELQESATNAALKAIKKPRKRNVKTAPGTLVDAPSTNVASIADENSQALKVVSKAIKKPRKKQTSSDETTNEVTNDTKKPSNTQKAATKTVKRPRKSKAASPDASIECVASKTITDATAEPDATVAAVKPIASKSRKKKIVPAERSLGANDIENPQLAMSIEPKKQPPKKPRKRKIAETADADATVTPSPAKKKSRKTETDAAAEIIRGIATEAAIASNTEDTKSI